MSPDEQGRDRSGRKSLPLGALAAMREFFWRNRIYLLRDLTVALLWVVVLTATFVVAPFPGWLYYVLLFGGLLVYSLVVSVVGAAAKL